MTVWLTILTLIEEINDQCNENFVVVESHPDYFELLNDDELITEGDCSHVISRLNQIARENGVIFDD